MKGLVRRTSSNEIYEENSLNLLMKHKDLEVVLANIWEKGGIIVSPLDNEKGVEFIYILKGELEYQDGEDTVILKEGDCLYHNQLEKSFTVYARTACQLITFSSQGEYDEVCEVDNKLRKIMMEIQNKDHYTKGHCERVGLYAQKLASYLKEENISVIHLMRAAHVHDIGKCKIPDEILLKPGYFTPQERQVMNNHTLYSYEILKNDFNIDDQVSQIAMYHHERYDGSGYPDGLKGEEIPIESQIIAIVDTFDAITTSRPYQKARTAEEAIEEMSKFAHTYNPKLFEIFKELVMKEVIGPHIIPEGYYKSE